MGAYFTLESLTELCNELNESNSTIQKKQVLSRYPHLQVPLKWIYNPLWVFNITSASCKKFGPVEGKSNYAEIIDLLRDLEARTITGHDAIIAVKQMINTHPEFEDLIYNIIDRNLKTRTNAKLINKVWPGLVPEFKVALANDYEKFKARLNCEDDWYVSQKFDGIRVLTNIDGEGNITFFSRRGKPFNTLSRLEDHLKQFKLSNVVLDGEVCILETDGSENFQRAVSELRRKDYIVDKPFYKIFDMLPKLCFEEEGISERFSRRLDKLIIAIGAKKREYCEVVPQVCLIDKQHLENLKELALERGWEGLILRRDTYYKGKRSNDMLKVKAFHEAEYKITGYEMSKHRIIEDGKEIEVDGLSAVKIEHKGNEVSVGSGFSIDERRKYFNDPSPLDDAQITVKYFEETLNDEGNYSLRFPTVKTLWLGERDC